MAIREDFCSVLSERLRFDVPQLSFCTHYSWFGITPGERPGIGTTHLFYNRFPGILSPQLLSLQTESPVAKRSFPVRRLMKPLAVEEQDGGGLQGTLAFLESDIVCYHARVEPGPTTSGIRAVFFLPATDPAFARSTWLDTGRGVLVVETRVPRTDSRDPDPDHPLTVCLRFPEGFEVVGKSIPEVTSESVSVELYAPKAGAGVKSYDFAVGIGEGPSAAVIADRVASLADLSEDASRSASESWLESALGEFSFDGIPEQLRLHYAKAAYQIICNTKAPRGRIRHLACYPSRGTYNAHYLWDACFTNLGVEQFNIGLAKDFLRVLCDNQEADGKIPQFVCATWNRPNESQPPLIAWSAWRLYERDSDAGFLNEIYAPVCRMVEWWFANRDPDADGLAQWNHRLESGWDDSPRFEQGPIAGVDLNSYLNREMRLLSEMARVLGKGDEANMWRERTRKHAGAMLHRLFDREDGLFYDRLVEKDRLHKVLTPASFTPLWTGVDVPSSTACSMIGRYLLRPNHFYGSRPFPTVAYSDPRHDSEKWWRGPVWPNIAWAMLQILKEHGYHKQYREAGERLLAMMAEHDELNELYSAATGKPLGAPGLCWGDAVFMALAREISALQKG